MPADRPRAWRYMGSERWTKGTDRRAKGPVVVWLDPGDIYIATEPLTPDDIPLAPPVEVTAEDVADGEHQAHLYGIGQRWNQIVADRINKRLAVRQEGE